MISIPLSIPEEICFLIFKWLLSGPKVIKVHRHGWGNIFTLSNYSHPMESGLQFTWRRNVWSHTFLPVRYGWWSYQE